MNDSYRVFPRKLNSRRLADLGGGVNNLDCSVVVGYRGYSALSGDFETYRINFSLSSENLRRIAISLLRCSFGENTSLYLPIDTDGLAKGLKIVAAVSVRGKFAQPKSFTYTPKRELKRYPWSPWSKNCDALTELPAFGVIGVPDECDSLLWDNRRDLRKPYAVYIGGSPKALIRLARLLLDYANTDIPPEEIDLEIEGGFRGVGPCSYEARFVRVD